jgi:parvulin-like peptidyl-prolyl isomerase
MKNNFCLVLILLSSFSLLGISACQDREASSQRGIPRASQDEVPRVRIQHILIAFKGSVPDERVTRSKAEAEALAKELFEQVKKQPSEFDALLRANTDDQIPGVYALANFGVAPKGEEFPRAQMVSGFSNLAFQLKAGEVGLVEYHAQSSPYGFHILMRLPD